MWTNEEMATKMNKIHNMDCLEFMKQVPDNYFDLVLTDPPYGIGIDGQKESLNKNGTQIRKKHDFKDWDSKTPDTEIFHEMFRISKNQIIWGANYFVDKLEKNTKGWIVWYKGQQGLTMSDCELAYSSYDYLTRMVNIHRTHLWQEKPEHPTQKPRKLFDYCINYAKDRNEVKTVFDPFMGSGTTALSSKANNISFCGTELEKDYCDIANKRLSKVQTSMFAFMDEVTA